MREEGIEHFWNSSTQIKTGNWTTIFQGKCESVKEFRLNETDPSAKKDPNLKIFEREGTNEHGEFWSESVELNEKTQYKRVEKTSTQPKHLRDDGFERKWGESREEHQDQTTKGEKWEELKKEHDDYWQRTTEKYEEYAK